MGRFDYWKRGKRVRSLSIKVPTKTNKPLVYFQILKGCFDESPYWNQAYEERSLLLKEIEKYRVQNPHADEQSVYLCMANRRAIYNRRIRKLEEAHIDYEVGRLQALREGLNKAFKQDIWDEVIAECNGGIMDLYNLYENKTIYNKHNK